MYPNKEQENRLYELMRLHKALYNGALEQRLLAAGFRPHQFNKRGRLITGWRRVHEHRTFLNKFDQSKDLTLLRRELPEYGGMNYGSSQTTLIRLDIAYKRFFKLGAGSPKFAGRDWCSFDYPSGGKGLKGNGWKLEWSGSNKGSVYLSDVPGTIRFRGAAKPLNCRQVGVILRNGRWYLQVVGDRLPKACHGTRTIAIDMGVSKLLTGKYDNMETLVVPKLAPMHAAKKKLASAQKDLGRKKRGSERYKKQAAEVARIHAQVARLRKHVHNDVSATIAKECRTVITETLNIKNMTAHGGAHKKGLNRHILDAGIGQFLAMLQYKVQERGGDFIVCETRGLAPTQRCHACWSRAPKLLSERVHSCTKCGVTCDRDENAALVMLQFAAPNIARRQGALL